MTLQTGGPNGGEDVPDSRIGYPEQVTDEQQGLLMAAMEQVKLKEDIQEMEPGKPSQVNLTVKTLQGT